MSTIVTREGKGSELTHAEVDANFTNLNSDKTENSSAAITGGAIDATTIGGTTPAAGTFTTLTATGQTSLGGAAGSEGLRVTPVASSVNWVEISGDSGLYPNVKAAGASSAVELRISSKGTGSVGFFTNNLSQRQLNVTHTASAVNYVQVTGAATGSAPVISSQGSDANAGLWLSTKGTGNYQFRSASSAFVQFFISGATSSVNYLQVSGATAGNAPTLSSQGSDTNIDLNLTPKGTGTVVANGPFTATGQTSLGGAAGSEAFRAVVVSGQNCYVEARGGVYGVNTPSLISRPIGAGAGFNFANGNSGPVSFYTNDVTTASLQMRVAHTASAVNYVQVTGAVTTGAPVFSAQGSDTNITLFYQTKGVGSHVFGTRGTTQQFRITDTGSAVNYGTVTGSIAGSAPTFGVGGSDTNIDLALTPKGTGRVKFGTHTATSDTAISGYIEIVDSSGTVRKLAVIS